MLGRAVVTRWVRLARCREPLATPPTPPAKPPAWATWPSTTSAPLPTRSEPCAQRAPATRTRAGSSATGNAATSTTRSGHSSSRIRLDATRSAGPPSRTDASHCGSARDLGDGAGERGHAGDPERLAHVLGVGAGGGHLGRLQGRLHRVGVVEPQL